MNTSCLVHKYMVALSNFVEWNGLYDKRRENRLYIMIDDHIQNYINGIIDRTDKGIVSAWSFLKWALRARWIDYKIDKQKTDSVAKNYHATF